MNTYPNASTILINRLTNPFNDASASYEVTFLKCHNKFAPSI